MPYLIWWEDPAVSDEDKPRFITHPEEYVWAVKTLCGCWKSAPYKHSGKEWKQLVAGGGCPQHMTIKEYESLKVCTKHRTPQTQKMF